MTGRGIPVSIIGLLLGSTAAAGQTIGIGATRWLTDPRVSDYRVSISSYRLGPIALFPFAQVAVQGKDGSYGGAFLAGVGGDAVIPLGRSARPYLVGGVSGGLFDFRRNIGVSAWHAWSAGVGAELVRAAGAGVAVEVRYQGLSRQRTGGVSLGVRVGSALGRDGGRSETLAPSTVEPERRSGADQPRTPGDRDREPSDRSLPSLATVSGGAASTRAVTVARAAMGTPYRWGGSDSNGFDCSGLIWYSYGQAGIELPRRSVDQARAGRSIGAELAALEPGDILVFTRSPGGEISHVGLYLGEGRFIHSASRGTEISRLAPDDPTGRWWFERWVDSRRVVE